MLGPGRFEQTTPGAVVIVEADERAATMSQPDPELVEVDSAAAVAALGLPGAEGAWRSTAGGTTHLLIPTDAPLEVLMPDLAAAGLDEVLAGARRRVGRRRHGTCHQLRHTCLTRLREAKGLGGRTGSGRARFHRVHPDLLALGR